MLYIQGETECNTWWQRATEAHIVLNMIPGFFVLSIMPFYVEKRLISIRLFLLSCLFPVPVLFLIVIMSFLSLLERKSSVLRSVSGPCAQEQIQLEENGEPAINQQSLSEVSIDTLGLSFFSSDSDTDIGSEYSVDILGANVSQEPSQVGTNTSVETEDTTRNRKFRDSREAITYTLLKHYKTLSLFTMPYTWLGVHFIYRVLLAACYTYITEPLAKLGTMSVIMLVMAGSVIFTRPYKHSNANRVAVLSFGANICIAFINAIKAVLVTFDCKFNCTSLKDKVLLFLSKIEEGLLVYVPIGAVLLALVFMAVPKCWSKIKNNNNGVFA